MVEQIINDGLGNVLTLRYDETTDTVSINNNNIHEDFREIYLNDAPDLIEDVVTIEDTNGVDEWENYTDGFGKWEINSFWNTHRKDKVSRGLNL